ncbi:MAG: Eco57I restriction-modification methylase domain-containing protein [Selenomonadaceae bacterium]|nr:Eco57I restriction-modification methylase domain-containing protein [Selenomonadaceae bacterium]
MKNSSADWRHDEIFVFNFFPTDTTKRHLPLEDRILEKLQMFHETLGEDFKYLSESEDVSPKNLFDTLNANLGSEDEEINPEPEYLKIIREMRDNDKFLFEKIKRLPKKALTGKLSDKVETESTLTFARNGALKTFFVSDASKTEQLSFLDAIEFLYCEPSEKPIPIGEKCFEQYEANCDEFKILLEENEYDVLKPKRTPTNVRNVVFTLKALARIPDFTDDQEEVIRRERSRSVQRNFVKALIEDEIGIDGAIVAFYSDTAPEKWRLSFVRLDHEFVAGKGGKVTITPAKRYSYLVGENEPCTTAYQQLFPIFENDSSGVTLDDLEEAFSVERVTKEFFDKYAEKFYQVKNYLENNPEFKTESQAHGFTAEQFAKKLLGQIIFLYFLQKKGWLGVERNSAWGTGSPNFMRKIFQDNERTGKNFFDEVLEPLFYTALNVDRSRQNDLYPHLNLRIPFLNGGLFDELDNYDWQKNNFSIPNEFFSNVTEKGRDADGILDIFDRYNFTINEDEPTEREVAIDPEMLGKVFENLLDSGTRKSKGAFYTPREIVHYMCRETLISYLVEKSKISEDAIRNFILYGDYFKDADIANFAENRDLQISDEFFSPAKNIHRLAELDKFLQEVKVADLAVGSGAFPLGMLNEITKAREVLTAYLNLGRAKKLERSLYDLKLETIKNSIFACDIEPSAVDIAKLRLWLTIVIDDEPTADKNSFKPKPLPNLDCNIICGNSLIDEFEGVPLIKHSKTLNNMAEGERQISLLQGEIDSRIAELIRVQKNLFHESDHDRKEEYRRYIRDIYDGIILEQLVGKPALKKKYKLAAQKKSLPFILWQLYFPTVFRDNGGFDIIVGNSPYVDSEEMTRTMPKLRDLYSKKFKSAKGNWDLYVLFIERGLELTQKVGHLSMIVPNKLISAPYAESIRKILSKNQIQEFRDYSNVNVFKSASVYPIVFNLKKTIDKNSVIMRVMKSILEIESENLIGEKVFYSDIDWNKYFDSDVFTLSIMQKMNKFDSLETIAKVNGAATVGEAYLIKDFLHDAVDDEGNTLKFINTGGIDKYKSFHGVKTIKYLKNNYSCPVVSISDLRNVSKRRLNESLNEKIIIGGMNKVLECFYDSGEYLAGKSTTIVHGNPHLKLITAILNSKLMSFYYRKMFGSMSLAGGFYRIGVPQMKILPIAIPQNPTKIKDIEAKVDELQSLYLTETEESREKEIFAEIDEEIYKIYGLNAAEIEYLKNFELEIRMSGLED